MSSMPVMSNCLQTLVMPPLSNWNTPTVLAPVEHVHRGLLIFERDGFQVETRRPRVDQIQRVLDQA